jgi:hypothetical protein
MKKSTLILTAMAFLASTPVMAQKTSGQGAVASTRSASDSGFAWGIGLGALVIVGTVVGIVAASASQSPSTHQH